MRFLPKESIEEILSRSGSDLHLGKLFFVDSVENELERNRWDQIKDSREEIDRNGVGLQQWKWKEMNEVK